MGHPRASRRRVTVGSSDDDSPVKQIAQEAQDGSKQDEPPISALGKLKSVKKAGQNKAADESPNKQRKTSLKSTAGKSIAKSKSKNIDAHASKQSSKPIFSFFNAATQRQRSSEPSASPEKPPTPHSQELEAIHDFSDDDAPGKIEVSQGSSTALALRKRKVQDSLGSDVTGSVPPSASQKFLKADDGRRALSLTVQNEDKRPWTEQFAPTDLSELAVHKRKVLDVRQWLDMSLQGRRQKVLILKGTAGTGKTTTVSLLAKDMDLDVIEWRNPSSSAFSSDGTLSDSSAFEDFVGRAGKATGLLLSSDASGTLSSEDYAQQHDNSARRRQILLVEEFPNTFSAASTALQSFRTTIMQYLASPPVHDASPTLIILVLSETLLSTTTASADSFTAHRLLGPEILSHPFVDTIEFNAVAPTILTKALESLIVKEARRSGRRRTPGPQVLRHVSQSGDIRSAISALEFLCLRGDEGETWSGKVTFTKPKRTKAEPPPTRAEEEMLRLISNRESTLGIFHSVGKVVYNKRLNAVPDTPQPPSHLPQHRRLKQPETDVDILLDDIGTDVSTFIAALHENYVLSCASPASDTTLDSICSCIDNLSDADLLSLDRFSAGTRSFSGSASDSLRQDELAFHVAAEGLLFNLPDPVRRAVPPTGRAADAYRMFYPSSARVWRKREEIMGIVDLISRKAQSGILVNWEITPSHTAKSGASGVESWAKARAVGEQHTDRPSEERDEETTGFVSASKAELLMDRLPFLADIVQSGAKSPIAAPILEQIKTVVNVSTLQPGYSGEDGVLEDADESAEHFTDQWATDRPDAGSPKKQKRGKGSLKQETEGEGLRIPVESQVERLVLEEDDIVDD
ncbi:hypothetical protein K431DRAFT_298720 [Polychaeton citri CBS 116435]|uniref:Checkpoint protein RAD24-like helical bundle domain-containing protein n=1 Tax=Polychaeton citri CBS 116435 TaxID=1314669 RepID=A0A9P4PYX4_9PEZI|nr:hypothetical protein K431DRAFT_298720 [Polychaeton citri CBS 116435]